VWWRRFAVQDYVVTGLFGAAALTVELALELPEETDWTEPFPVIDEPFRDWLVLSTREGRERADKLSDYFWYSAAAYPVIDSFVAPLVRGAPFDMVWQLEMMNLEAYLLSTVLTRLPHRVLGRARPNIIGCKDDPEYDEQCGSRGQLASFPGGHTSIAMTGAGLACAHHIHADLYGNETADAIACGTVTAAASMVPFFRQQADRHWISDNIAGILIGFPIGYGIPTLFYYHPFWRGEPKRTAQGWKRSSTAPRVAVVPTFWDETWGVSALGTF
jgi:membrane-associated phospholipid phosphatase